MKKEDNDRLKSLFEEIRLDEPSTDFESHLMQKIEFVASKKKHKRRLKNNLQAIFAMVCGVGVVISLPIILFRLLGWSLNSGFSASEFSSIMHTIKIYPLIPSVAVIGLLLLMSDTLIRKHMWEKKHKE